MIFISKNPKIEKISDISAYSYPVIVG